MQLNLMNLLHEFVHVLQDLSQSIIVTLIYLNPHHPRSELRLVSNPRSSTDLVWLTVKSTVIIESLKFVLIESIEG